MTFLTNRNPKKYIIPLVVYTVVVIFTTVLMLHYNTEDPIFAAQDNWTFVPKEGGIETILFLTLFILGAALIGGILGCFLSPLLLLLHKKIIGRNKQYGFQTLEKRKGFNEVLRGMFPCLMAGTLALIFIDNSSVQELFVAQDIFIARDGFESFFGTELNVVEIVNYMFLVSIFLMVGFFFFSGVWALSETGIVYISKTPKQIEKKTKIAEIKSTGAWYSIAVKGYAGIGAIFAYYKIGGYYTSVIASTESAVGMTNLTKFVNFYIFMGWIFLIPILTIPAIIILDLLKGWRVSLTKKVARKLGIVDEVGIKFEILT